ncbi:MAG: hypothetical protein Q9188_005004 [Gyalolechia gomerana]
MVGIQWLLLATIIPCVLTFATGLVNVSQGPEALAARKYFYVGGHYVNDGTGMHVMKDQMPKQALIGSTPRMGAKAGLHGSWNEDTLYTCSISRNEADQPTFLVTVRWQRPLTHAMARGQMGDPVFDAFYASQVQFQNETATVQTTNQRAVVALLDIIGPSIIITHSQGGPIGFLIADSRPQLVKALVSFEPQGPPFQDRVVTSSTAIVRPYGLTNIPITYSPPVRNPATDLRREINPPARPDQSDCVLQASPAKQLPNLATIPQLVVTTEASYHAAYDYCTVNYLRQAGVTVDFLDLPKAGVFGNAHLLFLERNNLDIAAMIESWIQRKI